MSSVYPERPKKRVIRWGVIALLFGLALVAYPAYKAMKVLRSAGNGNPLSGFSAMKDPLGQFPNKDKITILLIGKDYNRDSKGMPYTKNARADTIMLLGVDLKKKTLGAISIPRDTRVTAPDGKTGKINATLVRGNIELTAATVSEMFDVPIDYTVALKADAVKEIVNAVGGVWVEPIDDMKYNDSWGQLDIDLKKGRQRVNGEQAVGYVRFREVKKGTKHSKEEGDFRRTARQQELIRALFAEAMQPRNLDRADTIIDVGFQQIETNLTRPQLVALGVLFKGAGLNTMKTFTLEGSDAKIDGLYYFLPDMERGRALVDWVIKGDTLAANRVVRISVLNASGVTGVAKKFAARLAEQGFNVISGNAPKCEESTVYFSKAAFFDRAQDVRSMGRFPEVKKIVADSMPKGINYRNMDIVVVIGEDRGKDLLSEEEYSPQANL